jgi:hypothetical protein
MVRFLKVTLTPLLTINLLPVTEPVIVLPFAAALIVISLPLTDTPVPVGFAIFICCCAQAPHTKSPVNASNGTNFLAIVEPLFAMEVKPKLEKF